MKFDRSRPGVIVSGVVHAGLLAATLVAFSDTRKFEDASEAVPVEVISEAQLSQMMKGEKTAKPQPTPKPRVDKLAQTEELKPETQDVKRDVPAPSAAAEPAPTPPERPRDMQAEADAKAAEEARKAAEAAKAAEAKAAADAKARAEAAAKAAAAAAAQKAAAEARAKAEAAAQAKAEEEAQEALEKAQAAKAAEAKARAEAKAKADAEAKAKAIAQAKAEAEGEAKAEAEAKRKEEARLKAEQEAKILADMRAREKAEEDKRKQAEARQREAEQKKAEQQKLAALAAQKAESKFDPSNIEKLLHSREKPSQLGSTGREINKTASLGAPNASGPKLSPSQRDALGALLKEQLAQCWSPPAGAANVENLRPKIKMALNQDGSLSGAPSLANSSSEPGFGPMAESAMRAIRKCAPFKIPAQYAPMFNDWRDWSITFDAKEMLS